MGDRSNTDGGGLEGLSEGWELREVAGESRSRPWERKGVGGRNPQEAKWTRPRAPRESGRASWRRWHIG